MEIELGIEATEGVRNEEMRKLMADDSNLLALCIVLFGALPLLVTARILRARGIALTKATMKAPFYVQGSPGEGYAVLINLT